MQTMNIRRLFVMLVGLLWCALVSRADTHYVSLDGTNNPPYTTWAGAATQIQWAINAAAAGETVLVSNGTYNLTNQISLTNNITVQSLNGTNVTFINGNNYPGKPVTNSCIYMTKGTLGGPGLLGGFTISNGYYGSNIWGGGGGGIAMGDVNDKPDNCYVYNCCIYGNTCSNNSGYSGGGGIFIWSDGTHGVVISNCTVLNNKAVALPDWSGGHGGGIWLNSGPHLIIDSRISGNTATNWGGGIAVYFADGNVTITNCLVDGNRASYGGGIVHQGKGGAVANCVISNNVAGSRVGGIYLTGCIKLINSIIIGNVASAGRSGGIETYGGGSGREGVMISNCQVIANTATGGEAGGIYLNPIYNPTQTIMIVDSVIAGNVAKTNGGGIGSQAQAGFPLPHYPTNSGVIKNCLIYGNTNLTSNGGGVCLKNLDDGTPYVLINCTIAGNQAGTLGGGVWSGAASNYVTKCIINCIIYSNTTTNDNYDEIYNDNAVNTNNYWYTCVRPTPGTVNTTPAPNQNITNNPLFVDQASRDYRLNGCSPCVNAGTNQAWMTNAVDLGRRIRIRYNRVDMGAYETIYKGTVCSFH